MISALEHFGESIDRDNNLTRLEFCICNIQSDQFHHIMDSINNNSSLLSGLSKTEKYVLKVIGDKKWNVKLLFDVLKEMHGNKPYPCTDVEHLRRFFKNRKNIFQLSFDKTEVFRKDSTSNTASEKCVLNFMKDKKWDIETLFFRWKKYTCKLDISFKPCNVTELKNFLRKRKNMFQFSNDEKEVWSLLKGISVAENKIQEFLSLTEYVLYYMDGKNWNIEDLFLALKANHENRSISFQSVTELTGFFRKRKTIFQLSDDNTEVWSFGLKSIQDLTENINCHVTDENFEFMSPIEVIENEDGILTL